MSKFPWFQTYRLDSKCGRCRHDCKNDPDKSCPFFERKEVVDSIKFDKSFISDGFYRYVITGTSPMVETFGIDGGANGNAA